MFDKELIEKVCNLDCTRKDVDIDQTKVKYDTNCPFKKYYDVKIIIKAIKKYKCGEWDVQTISYWAFFYDWIICGGFKANVIEELNDFENLIKEIICWELDGLSFLAIEEEEGALSRFIKVFTDLDYILKTKDEWKFYCTYLNKIDRYVNDPYIILVNDKKKKYMIIHGVDGCCDCFNEWEHKAKKAGFIKYVEKLNEENYRVLSYAEKSFYEDIGK